MANSSDQSAEFLPQGLHACPTGSTEMPQTSEEKSNQIQGTIREDEEADASNCISKGREIELEEERKLKAKHPCIQRPGSEFLQKRLQRGQKYFDSGDYNMAKASTNPNMKLPDNATPVTSMESKLLNKRL